MRRVFVADGHEEAFREHGYVVVDLLDQPSIDALGSFYAEAFEKPRAVVPYAQNLPYYISIFDRDSDHRRRVDETISPLVRDELSNLMVDYRVFYSNFMIKFPGDGQIEAHQDFNFVDESRHAAFNLWCPLVDTSPLNGGLYVIPGSHKVFRSQRGPNLPRALTEYNDLFRKYARFVPIAAGQAAVFDHRLVHYSPPNRSEQARVAIQSVLIPREAPPVHYVFDQETSKVRAYRVDKEYMLENNLWEADLSGLPLDHEQDLIPFLGPEAVKTRLADLVVSYGKSRGSSESGRVFRSESEQRSFDRDGFAKLRVLGREEVERLRELFVEVSGGSVENTDYGMYISLEEADLGRKRKTVAKISEVILPRLEEHFRDCKPHLGSFLVKAPGVNSYTYPHQDWTFVDAPPYVSMTLWIALVDTDESNGALGFVRGSHWFFDQPVGSPSPDFQTCTQGHESILYEYLAFLPLKAGEAVVFDNRTIHGATPNLTDELRIAVAVGLTPADAPLYHYYLKPRSRQNGRRTVLKLKVEEGFFERYSVSTLKALFDRDELPGDCEVVEAVEEDFIAFSGDEVRLLCERAGLSDNGKRLILQPEAPEASSPPSGRFTRRITSALGRAWQTLRGS